MQLSAYPDTPRAIRLFPSHALQRLVLRHEDACRRLGLDVGCVADEDDGAVSRWLSERAGVLPAALSDDLERIDELAHDRSGSVLLDAGDRLGIDVRRIGLDPLETAVRVFLDYPEVFESAYSRQLVAALKGTSEFVGREQRPARPLDISALEAAETRLGRHFEARSRSAHCRISMGRDGDRLVFTIAHGALVRADESLDCGVMVVRDGDGPTYLVEGAVRYRPQRRDVVVYDALTGQLRIRAGDVASLQAYREHFGTLLHGDDEWFGDEPAVSLEPLLRMGREVERPTAGLVRVSLVGLIVRYTTGECGTVAIEAHDIWAFLAARMRSGMEDGELREAIFHMYRPGVASPTRVKVRVPNRVEYGKVDDTVFRPFLEERGFPSWAGDRPTHATLAGASLATSFGPLLENGDSRHTGPPRQIDSGAMFGRTTAADAIPPAGGWRELAVSRIHFRRRFRGGRGRCQHPAVDVWRLP